MSACLCVNKKSKKQSLMAISENDPRMWAGVVGTTGAKKRPRDLKNGSLLLTPPWLSTLRAPSLIFRRTKHRSVNPLIHITVLEVENVKSK